MRTLCMQSTCNTIQHIFICLWFHVVSTAGLLHSIKPVVVSNMWYTNNTRLCWLHCQPYLTTEGYHCRFSWMQQAHSVTQSNNDPCIIVCKKEQWYNYRQHCFMHSNLCTAYNAHCSIFLIQHVLLNTKYPHSHVGQKEMCTKVESVFSEPKVDAGQCKHSASQTLSHLCRQEAVM